MYYIFCFVLIQRSIKREFSLTIPSNLHYLTSVRTNETSKQLPQSTASSASSATDFPGDFLSAENDLLSLSLRSEENFVGDGVRDLIGDSDVFVDEKDLVGDDLVSNVLVDENVFEGGDKSRQLPNLEGLPIVGDCDIDEDSS